MSVILRHRSLGISVIELLIVVAIIVLVAILSWRAFISYGEQQSLLSETTEVVSLIREARERTIASDNRSQYGVRISGTSTALFRGGSYSTEGVEEVHVFTSRIMATTTPSLGTDVVFSRLTGEVVQAGDVILYLKNATTTKRTITITDAGLITTD